jgi:hypothetical protein
MHACVADHLTNPHDNAQLPHDSPQLTLGPAASQVVLPLAWPLALPTARAASRRHAQCAGIFGQIGFMGRQSSTAVRASVLMPEHVSRLRLHFALMGLHVSQCDGETSDLSQRCVRLSRKRLIQT